MILIRQEKCPSDSNFFMCDGCESNIGKENTMNWIHFGENHHADSILMLCDKCFKEL